MRAVAVLAFCVAFPCMALAVDIYVPDDHTTIQGAIGAAANGDVVVVRAGTYVENIDFAGKAITLKSQGGPDVTVIDGNKAGSVVTFQSGEGPGAVLTGFTVQNGSALYGGGIYCSGSSPTIFGNVVTFNKAGDYGGGMACLNSSAPTITGNTFKHNSFEQYSSEIRGGGLYCRDSSPTVQRNYFFSNSAWEFDEDDGWGAGICCDTCPAVTIVSNVFHKNLAGRAGGGLCCDGTDALIYNNLFHANEIIWDTSMTCMGGGICCLFCSPEIVNNTLCVNSSEVNGGAIAFYNASATICNTITWNNNADYYGNELYLTGNCTVDISYSLVCGGRGGAYIEPGASLDWGSGILDDNPLFINPVGDFHLRQDPCQASFVSPCVDAGDPQATPVDGSTRLDEVKDTGIVDMGYHYPGAVFVPGDYADIQAALVAAQDLDRILVHPGLYRENIDFAGKALILESVDGSEATTIDGGGAGSVVTFGARENHLALLKGFTLTNGAAVRGGGVICGDQAAPRIEGCIVTGNSADQGGGIHCRDGAAPLLIGTAVTYNQAEYGGGIFCRDAHPRLSYMTIAANGATQVGGGLCATQGSALVVGDSIIWDNTAPSGPAAGLGISSDPSTLTVSYSDVEGGQAAVFVEPNCTLLWGAGMLDVDPLFSDAAAGDFRLRQDPCEPGVVNPCVDASDPQSAPLEGSTRTDGYPDDDLGDLGFHYPVRDGVTLFVPDDCPTIKKALTAAIDGDTIVLRPGNYPGRFKMRGKAITLKSEAGPYATIITGDKWGPAVTFEEGEDSATVIEGFTITGTTYPGLGGGILCDNGSSPIIRNNIITANPSNVGGGIYCGNLSSPIIYDNIISDHSVVYDGGGIYCGTDSAPLITTNVISGNTADQGGGINCLGSNAIIRNNLIQGNSAESGAGIEGRSSNLIIDGNILIGNIATASNGGGIYFMGSGLTLCNNIIAGNTASTYGGGLFYIFQIDADVFINNTFTANIAGSEGGGIYIREAGPEIVNAIIWGNDAPNAPEIKAFNANPSVTFSDIQGGWAGTGNIDADPLFADAAMDDYHLTWDSPCRNTGDSTAIMQPFDFEGDPRIHDGVVAVDMGADEFHLHLYSIGDVIPGSFIDIKVVGTPGTTGLILGLGSGIQDPPQTTAYGDLWLLPPIRPKVLMPDIGSDGFSIRAGKVPAKWLPGERYPFQVLAGGKLSNLMVLHVDG